MEEKRRRLAAEVAEQERRRLEKSEQAAMAEAKAAAEALKWKQEAEAKRLAREEERQRLAVEAERKRQEAGARAKAEEERRREAEAQKQMQVAGLQRQDLSQILKNFQKAYENHDLLELQQITNMDEARARFLRALFNNYSTIKVETSIQAVDEQGASVKIIITGFNRSSGYSD